MWEKIKRVNLFPVLNFVIFIVGFLFFGLTFKMLWEWYVVTAFKVPPLSYPLAVGLVLIYTLAIDPIIFSQLGGESAMLARFKGDVGTEEQKKLIWKSVWSVTKYNVFFPLKCLAIGWFFNLFV